MRNALTRNGYYRPYLLPCTAHIYRGSYNLFPRTTDVDLAVINGLPGAAYVDA